MIRIHGRKNSLNVQKVMWAIGELGVAHERIDIGGAFGLNREPEYLELNPNGLVPTLQDGDFVLWESNAIVRYLARREGKNTLLPADPQECARADQWMDWHQTTFYAQLGPVFWNMIRTPPEERDMPLVERAKASAIGVAQILEAQLAKTAHVAGEKFSMGDIPLGIAMYRFRALITERPAMPNIDRWYGALEARKAFRDHVAAVPLT